MKVTNNSEYIYTKIKELILSGYFKENEKINQASLAKKFNVSRTPVVKTLYRLTSEGIIENIPNKGFYLVKFSLDELVDLLKIRQAFDKVLAESLIQTVTDEQINHMKNMFIPFQNCIWDEVVTSNYWDTDKEFHEYLLEICPNKWVKRIDDNFHIYGKVYHGGLIRTPIVTLPEHLNIINAIEEKNFEKTTYELSQHIQASIDVLENTIKTLDGFGYSNK
ncbi:MAG: GntR family transcriptional regulator [Clostridia bacterium]